MLISEFIDMIVQRFGYEPTADQRVALETFGRFLASRSDMPMMVMRGSAGTGKTSIVAAMVKTLLGLKQKVVLIAPTGRAAKVLSLSADHPALTIHRKIYRQKSFGNDFNLNVNLHSDTIFVVDEASMISSYPSSSTMSLGDGTAFFGTGNLLDDLVQYVYSGNNCRMMLVGDTAQLPPVEEDEAPALMSEVLYGYGATLFECDLAEVLRQGRESGILWNATRIRHLITHEEATELPKIRFFGFEDIVMMPGNELIESLATSYSRKGIDDTIVITRSNKRATIYNNGIRNSVLDRDDLLCAGDQLMIVKNNYFYSLNNSFVANGDRAEVRRVRKHRELYGFHFADVLLRFPDYDDCEIEATVLTDTLTTDAPALTREQSEHLFEAIAEDYADIRLKADRIKAIRSDRYFNALQVKFAYAVTCHKAQGGQWSHVYVDQGYMTDDMLTPDYIHWLYTAFTRATKTLYLVNWPKTQEEKR